MAGRTSQEVAGRATPESTKELAERSTRGGQVHPAHYRSFLDLRLSSLGVGTYLGDPDAETDREVEDAVLRSLTSGAVNVLDTAINYRYQRAERSVGRGLRAAMKEGVVRREQVFVSSKNGYLAPDAESGLPPRAYLQQELLGTGALRPEDIVDGSHAMSVAYLRDQLARSLHNLGLGTLDLIYLHNAAEAQLESVGRQTFFERLRSAFEFYEEARRKGRTAFFGMATWDSFRKGRHDEGYLALEEVVALAREVGGKDHGFRFIQFPLNVMMPEAASLRNQMVGGERVTLLEAASRLSVGTFSSVPLLQGQLTKGGHPLSGLTPAQSALQFARSAPHHLAPLVGQKSPAHVEENLALARSPPLDPPGFDALLR